MKMPLNLDPRGLDMKHLLRNFGLMTVHGRGRHHLHVPCREGNNWSHAYCRRQWSLADADHLRYRHLVAFEAALHAMDDKYHYVGSPHQIAFADDAKQVCNCG